MIAVVAALLTLLPLQPRDGVASWYGHPFHGRLTASGSIYNQREYTCAHRTLPLGTIIEVRQGKLTVILRVTDRGPYVDGRVLDLSRAGAKALDMIDDGVADVTYRVVGRDVTGLRYNLRGGTYAHS